MRIIVTGHMGYIGRVLVPTLVSFGHDVLGIDVGLYAVHDQPHPPTSAEELRKDVRDVTAEDIAGHDAIIHLAALSNDPRGEWPPGVLDDINHAASVRLAKLAKKAGIRRFFFSSSCSVYGRADSAHVHTELDVPMPITEYAKSKYLTELDLAVLADSTFCPVFMRNATVYGYSPSWRFDMLVNDFTGAAFFNRLITITGDGYLWRPQIHVQDLAAAFVRMLDAPRNSVANRVFNIGFNEENYRVRDIAYAVQRVLPDVTVCIAKAYDPDARSYRVDFTAFDQVLRPAHVWRIERGIADMVRHLADGTLTREQFTLGAGRRLVQLEGVDRDFPGFLQRRL